MRNQRLVVLALVALFVGPFVVRGEARAGGLRAGVSAAEITPITDIVSYRMTSPFSELINTGLKDPLLAKAIVLEQGGTKAALVFCDLIGVPRETSDLIRATIEREIGIPAANVAIIATNTHNGPLYFGALRDELHGRVFVEHGYDRYEVLDFSQELAGRVLRVVEEADRALQPVELAAGSALEHRQSFNNRYWMKDGTVVSGPQPLDENIVRPAGPADPEIGIVALRASGSQAPAAALISFALKPDTLGGTEFSADYPHALEEGLRSAFGRSFVSLFSPGACADVCHVDVHVPEQPGTEELGNLLAETIGTRIPELPRIANPRLAVHSEHVELRLQERSDDEVAAARVIMSHVGDPCVSLSQGIEACKIVELAERGHDGRVSAEVQAVRLSDEAAVVALPGDLFVELGMAIKAASPFKTTLVFGLANDTFGPIPTHRAFEEGGMEVVRAQVAAGEGEVLVDAALRALKAVQSQRDR